MNYFKKIKLGVVTTWNTKCGISTYSQYLVDDLKKKIFIKIFANNDDILQIKIDEDFVKRCWQKTSDNLDNLFFTICEEKVNIILFQFSSLFFKVKPFFNLIKKLKDKNIKMLITFHSFNEVLIQKMKEVLNFFDVLIVHKKEDAEYLKLMGFKRINLIPHGIKKINKKEMCFCNIKTQRFFLKKYPIIGSFGFLLPHKNIKSIIKAINLLKIKYKDILYLGLHSFYNSPYSLNYYADIYKYIKSNNLQNNIHIITDFLKEEVILSILKQCDILIFPYANISESVSGAIRFAILSEKPIITTNIDIFSDVKNYVYQIRNSNEKTIAIAIEKIIKNKKLNNYLIKKSKEACGINLWENIAENYLKSIIASLD